MFTARTIPALLAAFAVFGPAVIRSASAQEKSPTPSENTPVAAVPMQFSSGAVTLKVRNYDDARQKLLDAAERSGAALIDAHTEVTPNGRRHGWVRLRFPADRLPVLLGEVRQAGILYAEKITTTDNASEYNSLERRVERLQKHQGRLDGILNSERRLRGSDILYVQERLFRAGVDESLLAQRRADMERRRTQGTMQVQLFEPIPVAKLARARIDLAAHFASAQNNAVGALGRFMGRITTAFAYALVWAPLWLPVMIVFLVLLRRLWQSRHLLINKLRLLTATVQQRVAAVRNIRTAAAPGDSPAVP